LKSVRDCFVAFSLERPFSTRCCNKNTNAPSQLPSYFILTTGSPGELLLRESLVLRFEKAKALAGSSQDAGALLCERRV
jgi:hypothetical protein